MSKEFLGTYIETFEHEEGGVNYVVKAKIVYVAPDHFARIGLAGDDDESTTDQIKRVFSTAIDSVKEVNVDCYKSKEELGEEKLEEFLKKKGLKPAISFTDISRLGLSSIGMHVIRQFVDRYGRGVELGELF